MMKSVKESVSLVLVCSLLVTAFAMFPAKDALALNDIQRVWWCLNDGTTKSVKIDQTKITLKGKLRYDLTTPTDEWPATSVYNNKTKSFPFTSKSVFKVSKDKKMVKVSKETFTSKYLNYFLKNKKGYKTLLVYVDDYGNVKKVSLSKKERKEVESYDD